MKAPIRRLTKKEIVWLSEHYCRHSHTYLDHYNCFLAEQPEDCPFVEQVGFLDIETTSLHGDTGYITSYAIKERDGDVLGRVLNPAEIKNHTFDRKLVEECFTDMKKFHRLVVYYGGDYRFDIPFLRTRAVYYELEFPLYKDVYLQDAYSVIKSKFNFQRRSLWKVCQLFDISEKGGHWITPQIQHRAMTGDPEALEIIWKHNVEDVIATEKLWNKIEGYVLRSKRSI